jgi:hypothetical protein
VGNGGDTSNPISLSDANAASLLDAGLSFAEHDNIEVEAGATHLSTSLQGLQKLQVDSVVLAQDADAILVNEMHVNLFNEGETPGVGGTPSISDILSASLPNFDQASDVTLDLLNSLSDSSVASSLELFNNDGTQDEVIRENLVNHGIDYLAIHEALSIDTDSDWLNIDDMQAIHNHKYDDVNGDGKQDALGFEVHVSGTSSGSAISFDEALFNEAHNIFSGTTVATEDENYGNLIQALSESGVQSFVVESGQVEITDYLASALVDAGMLTALPNESNLTLDASADNIYTVGGESFAHLSTSLKAIGDLGVDNITASGAKLYVDLGFPVGDPRAMKDIHDLLASLDPAGAAKPLAVDESGNEINVSLLISADMLSSWDKLTESDLLSLDRLGINEISIMNTEDNALNSSVNNVKDAGLVTSAVYGTEGINLPTVRVIGLDDDLHDILDAEDKPK